RAKTMSLPEILKQIQEESLAAYRGSGCIKTFPQFLEDFFKNPYLHLRTAPQYVLEMFEHFGTRAGSRIGQEAKSFKLFDDVGAEAESLIGQERAQQNLYAFIKSFAQKGRADKMVLLHGPNGSGKTTMIECIFRGLESFSHTPQGTLLRFSWLYQERE